LNTQAFDGRRTPAHDQGLCPRGKNLDNPASLVYDAAKVDVNQLPPPTAKAVSSPLPKADLHASSVDHHLSTLRICEGGGHADRCLPVFLCLHRLWHKAKAQGGRLLRVLFLRIGAVSSRAGGIRLRRRLHAALNCADARVGSLAEVGAGPAVVRFSLNGRHQ
jgi:hypothetical protein